MLTIEILRKCANGWKNCRISLNFTENRRFRGKTSISRSSSPRNCEKR